jgi:hypothetical protein
MTRVVIQGRLVGRAPPGPRSQDFDDPDQNKKYL